MGASRHSTGTLWAKRPPLLPQGLHWSLGIFVRFLAALLEPLGPGHMGHVILQWWTQSSVAVARDVHEQAEGSGLSNQVLSLVLTVMSFY